MSDGNEKERVAQRDEGRDWLNSEINTISEKLFSVGLRKSTATAAIKTIRVEIEALSSLLEAEVLPIYFFFI